MHKIVRFFLLPNRRRRSRALGAALWILRILRDIEHDEMLRYEDLLLAYDRDSAGVSKRRYLDAEEDWSACEYALAIFDFAVDDLEQAY